VIRGVRGNPVRIGDNVLVGPRAYLTGCEVADNAFLATGTTVFNSARVGARAEVRINGNCAFAHGAAGGCAGAAGLDRGGQSGRNPPAA
jgi:carbonic anhydrase/acetyltransferase-like protein (isoleucine patch superfamily)